MMDWKIYALGSAVFAGMTAVLAKIGVKNIPSNLATLIRTFVILFFIGMLVAARQEWRNPFHLNRHSLIFLILSGITTGLSWLCYYRALQSGPASLVTSIDKFSLVFAIFFSILFLHERLNAQTWTGAILITAGALLIALK